MSSRKCDEAVSGGAWSVLEKDCMLGLGVEVRHVGAVQRSGGGGVCQSSSSLAAKKLLSVQLFDPARAREKL